MRAVFSGTVSGALDSGFRAARDVLGALSVAEYAPLSPKLTSFVFCTV